MRSVRKLPFKTRQKHFINRAPIGNRNRASEYTLKSHPARHLFRRSDFCQSSIMKLFPLWAKGLRSRDAVIKGNDLAVHVSPEWY